MRSRTTRRFHEAFEALPAPVQRQARDAYQLFERNPHHPSLHFRQVHPTRPIYSVRITAGYRAVGVREADAIIWFWISSHADYDHLLSRL